MIFYVYSTKSSNKIPEEAHEKKGHYKIEN